MICCVPRELVTFGTFFNYRFWKIAQTFTGLKLKGEIAKFGQIELSDVSAFYTFPDGKVISSTEYGTLLLWEGMFIKCLIRQTEEVSCHKKNIEVIFRYEDFIVTAGDDGYIRFWDALAIDQCEGDDDNYFNFLPTKEIYLESEPGVIFYPK